MHMVCLLEVRNTVSFTLVIDYIHYQVSFEVLQAKVKCRFSTGSARRVPRALP